MIPHSLHATFGHITPPEDDCWRPDFANHNLPMHVDTNAASHGTDANGPLPARGRQSISSSHFSSSPSAASASSGHKPDKKERYREKNRVAAAKCRAKKKSHVDGLEENHRTQSMLNSLLKQTEQNLRDELSFWRTQALQHAFCDCHAVQDYNLKKARALAADKEFGGLDSDSLGHDSLCTATLPGDGHGEGEPNRTSVFSPRESFDRHAI